MKKRKRILLISCVLGIPLLLFLIYSLTIVYQYPGAEVHKCILEYQYVTMDCVAAREIHNYTVRVYSDRKYEIQLDEKDVVKALENPVGEFTMTEAELGKLKKSIKKCAFFLIPTNIGHSGCDGYESHITVYTKHRKHTTGGYLPFNRRYDYLEDTINKLTKKNRKEFFDEKQQLVDAYYGEND